MKNPQPNRLSFFILLTPLIGIIGIFIGLLGISYIAQIYPDAVNRVKKTDPNNYYLAYLLLNLATFILLCVKPIRQIIFRGFFQLSWTVYFPYLVYVIICTNLMDIIILRRIAFGASMIALAPICFYFYNYVSKKTIRDYLIAISLPLLLIISVVPGFFFPPFYDGIAGWTSAGINQETELKYKGYQLVRDDGETIWYTSNFFSPVTQIGRFPRALNFTMEDELASKFLFLYENYERIYPTLQKKRLPHQKILGKYAYPTHNLSNFNSQFLHFPPNRISLIRETKVTIDRQTGEKIQNDIINEYNVAEQIITK